MSSAQGGAAAPEDLKPLLWFYVSRIVDRESLSLGVNATPQFISALTELVWSQTETLAQDLETFARHAGRTTVTTDDVLLVARRTDALGDILRRAVRSSRRAGARSGSGRGPMSAARRPAAAASAADAATAKTGRAGKRRGSGGGAGGGEGRGARGRGKARA